MKLKDSLSKWYELSREAESVYPSQGLLRTPFDYLDYSGLQSLPYEKIVKTLEIRKFFLQKFNEPQRILALKKVTKAKFKPPVEIDSKIFKRVKRDGISLSIGDLGATVMGADKPRTSRNERYTEGPFIKMGKQARIPFVGSASPDVWNSAAAISTMAASHALAAIPRNGVLADVKRQADLAKEVFKWLDDEAVEILDKNDREEILKYWKNNVMGTLEANPDKALERAEALFEAGVRTFRVYSPEPGTGPEETVKSLRKKFKNEIEIFAGHLVDVKQAKRVETAGADGITVGIGGGGRCITGVRSGSVIDWPELVWNLRGKVSLPIIVEGGASDHIAVSLLLGVSGIGVSRVVSGGTIESPGGALYAADKSGKLFKPYGGEASARTKFLDGKLLPYNIPSFVEGETTKAYMSYVAHVYPTLTYNLHMLLEDAILAMVFRNVSSIYELQSIDPSPLRQSSQFDLFQRKTH